MHDNWCVSLLNYLYHFMKQFFLSLSIFALFLGAKAQDTNDFNGLLWKISGNGLSHPSYLYGTMHVSNRVAFHLSETFFKALEDAEVIALEGDPGAWIHEIAASPLIADLNAYSKSTYQPDLYGSFVPYQPSQSDLGTFLSREDNLLNSFLWRTSGVDKDFEEQTYLDLFIYQAAKKGGKIVVGLEDFDESMRYSYLANKYDKDAKGISNRQAQTMLGDYSSWYELQEDAYRKGDLAKIDTLSGIMNPGKYHRKYMLNTRNEIMVNGIDSLLKHNRIFIGVGAAHLPGKMGVITLLRNLGYTVTAEPNVITKTSIAEKEVIDEKIFTYQLQDFVSDDGLISTKFPQLPKKFRARPIKNICLLTWPMEPFTALGVCPPRV